MTALVWRGVPLAILLTTASAIVALHRPIPQSDYWEHVDWLGVIEASGFRFADLFAQANEHRIALARLVFRLDDWLAGSTGALCLAVIALSALALIALHVRMWRDAFDDSARRRFVPFAAITLGALFSQSENFLWENQVQFLFVYLFAALAIAAVAIREGRREAPWRHAAALAALAAATWSMANGVLAFGPVVLLLALERRWCPALFYAMAGAAMATLYLSGYERPAHHPDPLGALFTQPHLVMLHALLTAGSFIGRASHALGASLGAVAVGYAAWRTARWLLGERLSAPERFSLAFCLFILASIGVTALGRAGIAVDQGLSSRYQTPVNVLWLNLMLLALADPWLGGVLRDRRLFAAAALIGVAALGVQAFFLKRAAENAVRLELAMDAVAAGVDDTPVVAASGPTGSPMPERVAILRRQNRSLFSDPWYARAGQPAAGDLRPLDGVEETAAEGRIVTARLDAPGGWSLSRRVALVDGCGRIAGFGRLLTAADPNRPVAWSAIPAGPVHLRAYLANRPAPPAVCAAPERLSVMVEGRGG